MGTIQTIRPNGTSSGGGAFVNTGGGSLHGALSDTNPATYVRKDSGAAGIRLLYENLTTYAMAGTVRCKRARIGVDYETNSNPKIAVDLVYPGWDLGGSRVIVTTPNQISSKYSAWMDTLSLGTEFTQTVIDALQLKLVEYRDGADRGFFREVYLELDIIDQPTVTVSPGATGTLKPTIAFAYADGDGDVQSRYQVKVFDSATYSAGGFDPETSTPAWDSAELSGDDASVTLDVQLTNAVTYKAYVKVAHDGGSIGAYWSTWAASAAWTIALTPCTTPTVTATFDAALNRVVLTGAGAAPPVGVTQTLRFEKSYDAGLEWEAVRDWASGTFPSPYAVTGYDYETPRGVGAVLYRAVAVGVNGTGDDVSSTPSAPVAVGPTLDGKWWLKAPGDPGLNLSGVRVTTRPEIDVDETIGVFRPMGSGRAVTVAGDIGGEDGVWLVSASELDQVDKLAALVYYRAPLLVQDPFGGHRYVRIIDRGYYPDGTPDHPRTYWQIAYVETHMPAVE